MVALTLAAFSLSLSESLLVVLLCSRNIYLFLLNKEIPVPVLRVLKILMSNYCSSELICFGKHIYPYYSSVNIVLTK